ncbi:hypothetical protein EJ03DRAFT_168927 [Teratosphaeria nubilosa]|uniref:Uncharacterized protein n=1 Tax=Teratosphaeria nubilosa TaxID=161662 RepID=A0A6G1LJG8_9PEZI|nr:hypothetical protein EJ03DRAFT_168927 [Teratosphaeria nubilosa]
MDVLVKRVEPSVFATLPRSRIHSIRLVSKFCPRVRLGPEAFGQDTMYIHTAPQHPLNPNRQSMIMKLACALFALVTHPMQWATTPPHRLRHEPLTPTFPSGVLPTPNIQHSPKRPQPQDANTNHNPTDSHKTEHLPHATRLPEKPYPCLEFVKDAACKFVTRRLIRFCLAVRWWNQWRPYSETEASVPCKTMP